MPQVRLQRGGFVTERTACLMAEAGISPVERALEFGIFGFAALDDQCE
jgi:hypothetical protein